MVIKTELTRMTQKIVIQLHLVAESCTICSSCSRRPVPKFLDTPLYTSALKSQIQQPSMSTYHTVNTDMAQHFTVEITVWLHIQKLVPIICDHLFPLTN